MQRWKEADWVCLKVDAVNPDIWHSINKPHHKIDLNNILEGMLDFANSFRGELNSETMLIRGFNDSEHEVGEIAAFLAKLKPTKAYLAVPTRPTAENIEPAIEQTLNASYQAFSNKLGRVEYLISYEGNDFASTRNAADDLLSITAVHPMRKDAVAELLKKDEADWEIIRQLISEGSLVELEYRGRNSTPGRY